MDNEPRDQSRPDRIETRLAHAGHDPRAFFGFVQPPVVHASTVLYDRAETARSGKQRYVYGRRGTPTTDALSAVIAELEGAEGTVLFPSGLAACAMALTAVTRAGDRVLMSDSVYGPTRRFAVEVLANFGVETVFFDPLDTAAFRARLAERATAAVYLEAPGSLTFEVPDLPALTGAAREADATVLFDNTWATPLFFRPLENGADLSIEAGTKYFSGASDLLIGSVSGSGEALAKVKASAGLFGTNVGPDDVYLTLRGLRTLAARMPMHHANGLDVARWLAGRPEVHRVLHPALPGSPGHEHWKRLYTGASGLFAIVFRDVPQQAVDAFLDSLRLFGMGASWGGFESLILPEDIAKVRSATRWPERDQSVRLHIGLENPADLIADLEQGLARLRAAA